MNYLIVGGVVALLLLCNTLVGYVIYSARQKANDKLTLEKMPSWKKPIFFNVVAVLFYTLSAMAWVTNKNIKDIT